MARFIALLLIGPWLAVLSWLYWLYTRRRRAVDGVSARFDAGIIVAGWLSAVLCTALAFHAAYGRIGGALWQQIAAAWAAYPGYFVVLFFGLFWHWLAGRRRRVDT